MRPGTLASAVLGVDPDRVADLAALLDMPADRVIRELCVEGPERTVAVNGLPIRLRPGTADVFTIDDTFTAGYHRSLWPLPDAPVIVDLGAHIGSTALDYSLTHPGASITAVELDAANFRLLEENTRARDGITAVHAGVATHDGELTYDGSDTNTFSAGEGGSRSSPAMTVDSICPGPVDLLKMDIEGAEQPVLRAGRSWAGRVAHILVETHAPYTREECLRDLEALGFEAALDDRHTAAVSGTRHTPG